MIFTLVNLQRIKGMAGAVGSGNVLTSCSPASLAFLTYWDAIRGYVALRKQDSFWLDCFVAGVDAVWGEDTAPDPDGNEWHVMTKERPIILLIQNRTSSDIEGQGSGKRSLMGVEEARQLISSIRSEDSPVATLMADYRDSVEVGQVAESLWDKDTSFRYGVEYGILIALRLVYGESAND